MLHNYTQFFTLSLLWNVTNYAFLLKIMQKVLIGVCGVSLIISNKNLYKMFSNNSKNYSYAEDNINEMPLIWSVSPMHIPNRKIWDVNFSFFIF